jgi:hypothetical protein
MLAVVVGGVTVLKALVGASLTNDRKRTFSSRKFPNSAFNAAICDNMASAALGPSGAMVLGKGVKGNMPAAPKPKAMRVGRVGVVVAVVLAAATAALADAGAGVDEVMVAANAADEGVGTCVCVCVCVCVC